MGKHEILRKIQTTIQSLRETDMFEAVCADPSLALDPDFKAVEAALFDAETLAEELQLPKE